jgi:uncharacterized damage-inducible protein DinB
VLGVELTPATASGYVRLAFDQMLAVADRLGDDAVNVRPIGPDTNAVAALVVHCCGVAEFWLGHVGLGRASHRDRPAEFSTTATVAELHARVEAAQRQIDADLVAIDAGAESAYADKRRSLGIDPTSDASLVLHVIEELFQHLGHCEIAADALLAP